MLNGIHKFQEIYTIFAVLPKEIVPYYVNIYFAAAIFINFLYINLPTFYMFSIRICKYLPRIFKILSVTCSCVECGDLHTSTYTMLYCLCSAVIACKNIF